MGAGRVTRWSRASTWAGAAAALVLLVPSPAEAFPLPEPSSHFTQQSDCPARAERGDDFPAPTRRSVRALVREFVAAYNAGDLARLDATIAPEEDFEWYFVDGERFLDAHERSTLLPYFAQRHALGDRLRLIEVGVGREIGWHGGYDLSVRLRRSSADDGARGTWHGKAAADCAIFVWSLGRG